MKPTRRPVLWTLLLAAVTGTTAFAACDDDATGPAGPGEVDAVMTDPNGAATSAGQSGSSSAAAFSGTFEGDVRIEISTDGETWVELGEGSESVSVALQSSDATTIRGEVEVPGGSYTRVRVVMEEARAELEAGAVIGDVTYSDPLTISVAGGSEVVVEAEIFPFTVDPDTHMVVVVDLNSEAWVTSEAAESGTAASAEVSAAVGVEARRR